MHLILLLAAGLLMGISALGFVVVIAVVTVVKLNALHEGEEEEEERL